MKKLLLLAILILAVMMIVACKPAEQPAEDAESAETTQAAPAPNKPAAQAEAPGLVETEDEDEAGEIENVAEEVMSEEGEPEKVGKAGLGVIFVTEEMKGGLFRVKVNGEKLVEHTFEAGSSLTGKEIRVERELTFPAGENTLKFIVQDAGGMKAFKEHTMVFEPKSHHVIKIECDENPSSMTLKILE